LTIVWAGRSLWLHDKVVKMSGCLWVLFGGAILSATPGAAQQSPAAKPKVAPSAWEVVKRTDVMTDKVESTLVSWAPGKRVSIRVSCNDSGAYVVLFTLPKTVQFSQVALTEVRFDKGESAVYTLSPIAIADLVRGLGGDSSASNYAFAALDPQKGLIGETKETISEGGKRLVSQMRKAERLVYRLTLASPGEDTEGAFNIRGFEAADKRAQWSCGK
jgi:hypothetical protein